MKTILITGSNSDIGMAIAKALTGQPLQLALVYDRSILTTDNFPFA